MKILAWGLLVVALMALGAVWLLGTQKRNTVIAANHAAEQATQRQIDDAKNAHTYELKRANGSLNTLTDKNSRMEADIEKLDADIAEYQVKIDAVGDTASLQERADLMTDIVRLREENNRVLQEIKARGGN